MKKPIILTFFSIAFLLLFFLLPPNRKWFSDRIVTYWNDFTTQKKHLSLEERKTKRWGRSYTLSKDITGFFKRNNQFDKAIVLLPPSGYFKEKKIDYHVPEPAVFYYYTGLKTVWINSNDILQANWMVVADSGQLLFVPVTNKKNLVDSIASFKKYPVSL